jgi:hypothetical protein
MRKYHKSCFSQGRYFMHLFKPATHGRGRIRCLLLSLLVLAAAEVNPAHANAVSSKITSGVTKTGALSGASVDTYTFAAAAGGTMVAVVSETGTHDDNFIVGIERTTPGGAARGNWKTYSSEMVDQGTTEGTWTYKISRAENGTSGSGSYKLNVMQVPYAGATAMNPSQIYNDSLAQGDIKVYSFTGTAGQAKTLTLSQTSGTGYPPKLSIYDPSGNLITGKGCTPSCQATVQTAANGVYTVLMTRYDEGGDASGYSFSVNSVQ